MSIHDLRDYYKRQEAAAALQMMGHGDNTIEHMSADETYMYMREQHYKYAALCKEHEDLVLVGKDRHFVPEEQ